MLQEQLAQLPLATAAAAAEKRREGSTRSYGYCSQLVPVLACFDLASAVPFGLLGLVLQGGARYESMDTRVLAVVHTRRCSKAQSALTS